MNNIETTVDSNPFWWLRILMAMDLDYELTQSSLEKFEKLELPLKYIQEIIDAAAERGYIQVYLIALKKKEQFNDFNSTDIKENFEL